VKKIRLDQYLAQKGLSRSREQARKEIISGWVKVNGETVRDPAKSVPEQAAVIVERPGGLYVSRGGDKLKKALDLFSIDIHGLTAVDLGASTGGFTDCMLKHGAAYVYAVDVGYGQLDYSLRNDHRVKTIERCNARDAAPEIFDREINFITADLSFISILKVAGHISALFQRARGIFLIKPQFEAGKDQHNKGVVRDPGAHKNILISVLNGLRNNSYNLLGLTFSPVRGPAGNIEFLLYFSLEPDGGEVMDIDAAVNNCVEEAHNTFSGSGTSPVQ
jgi:23S rRNA (cytidine1920-2'-O)/16S rRNA (cytidine1409-2'-O)-methyltransferase